MSVPASLARDLFGVAAAGRRPGAGLHLLYGVTTATAYKALAQS